MAHRLRTPEGKALYARRKSTVETVFGIVKEVMGFRRFHLRGFQAAQGEWNLVCMAWNLKRMHGGDQQRDVPIFPPVWRGTSLRYVS